MYEREQYEGIMIKIIYSCKTFSMLFKYLPPISIQPCRYCEFKIFKQEFSTCTSEEVVSDLQKKINSGDFTGIAELIRRYDNGEEEQTSHKFYSSSGSIKLSNTATKAVGATADVAKTFTTPGKY